MPRYKDDWLIDRVLFDYVSGGSCACCGFSHLFLPNGTQDFITSMTDLETDSQQREIDALEKHPWPTELRDQVWSDRVKLRQRFKKDMNTYNQFWNDNETEFRKWMIEKGVGGGSSSKRRSNVGDEDNNNNSSKLVDLKRIFQLPRTEIMEVLRSKYNIHSAYAVVLCAAVEQVAFFNLTEYAPDGRGYIELNFESRLQFDRRGGFTFPLFVNNDNDNNDADEEEEELDMEALEVWFKRMKSLSGPKLLERGPKSRSHDNNENDEDDDNDNGDKQEQNIGGATKSPATIAQAGPSFQSDRRMVRLLIAKYWAEALMKRYKDDDREKQQQQKEKQEEQGGEAPAASSAAAVTGDES